MPSQVEFNPELYALEWGGLFENKERAEGHAEWCNTYLKPEPGA